LDLRQLTMILPEAETFNAPDGDDFYEGAEGKEQLL
jgi:hypothetical protein